MPAARVEFDPDGCRVVHLATAAAGGVRLYSGTHPFRRQ